MQGMKYIIVDECFAVIFPAAIYHKDAFSLFRGTSNPCRGTKVTGAGYIGADAEGKLYVYGRSDGYGIESDPADLEIVMSALHRNSGKG